MSKAKLNENKLMCLLTECLLNRRVCELKTLRDLFEWNVCANIWSTDLLLMSPSTLCLNKTKYDPSRHMRIRIFEQLFCRWQMMKMCFLAEGLFDFHFLFKNEMNEIGVCENDKNRDYHFERTFGFYHLSSLFVSFLWFDPIDRISDL